MTEHLSLIQIAGINGPTYEEFYKEVETDDYGNVSALVAAKFLKRSELSDSLLSQMWDMSDRNGHGYLSKQEFFVAMKLVALAQSGKEPSLTNITNQVAAPKFKNLPSTESGQASNTIANWTIKPDEKIKYDKIFEGLQPQSGKIPGDKVRPVLLNSNLPIETLGKIWDLSDYDKDGCLDDEEFALAMHFVYKCLEGESLPSALTGILIPPSKRKSNQAGDNTSFPAPNNQVEWIVRPEEKLGYDTLFYAADRDKDGFVSGYEIKDTFMRSGLHQTILAKIWDLCDVKGTGLLNSEQFALAMHLINEQRAAGPGSVELPATITPEMMPPSIRSSTASTSNNAEQLTYEEFGLTRESDKVYDEIEEIKNEHAKIEREIANLESQCKIGSAELQLAQRNLDETRGTCRTIESQKVEAQKRISDYEEQKQRLDLTLKELREKCEQEKGQVDQLKNQLNTQQISIKGHEESVSQLRGELNDLMREESNLKDQVHENQKRLQTINAETGLYATQIDQSQTRVNSLESTKSQLQQVVEQFNSLLNGDLSVVEPDSHVVKALLSVSTDPVSLLSRETQKPMSGISSASAVPARPPAMMKPIAPPLPASPAVTATDPFANEDPFKNSKIEDPFHTSDPFAMSDPFGGDPFQDKSAAPSQAQQVSSGFSADPFDDLFSKAPANKTKVSASPAFTSDPFGNDAFANGGDREFDGGFAADDPFGADPFNPKGKKAPGRPARPASSKQMSSPQVKKSGGPPPRPGTAPFSNLLAPSPNNQMQASSSTTALDPFDPFATPQPMSNNDPGFANFGNFDTSDFGAGASAFTTESSNTNSSVSTNVGRKKSFEKSKRAMNEQDELLWATQESHRLAKEEEDARRREEADLELALKLSELESAGKKKK